MCQLQMQQEGQTTGCDTLWFMYIGRSWLTADTSADTSSPAKAQSLANAPRGSPTSADNTQLPRLALLPAAWFGSAQVCHCASVGFKSVPQRVLKGAFETDQSLPESSFACAAQDAS